MNGTSLSPGRTAMGSGLAEAVGPWLDAGLCTPAEAAVVDTLARRSGVRDARAELACVLALAATRHGHVGLRIAPEIPWAVVEESDEAPARLGLDTNGLVAVLEASPLVRVDPKGTTQDPAPEDERPFVLSTPPDAEPVLATRRVHHVQVDAARTFARLATATPVPEADLAAAEAWIDRLLSGETSAPARNAVRHALSNALTIVTGGPGTGKTYTVQRLLAVLLAAAPSDHAVRIAVAAPTGKAAARLTEALREGIDELDVPEAVRDALAALRGRTLHDLLRIRPDGGSRYGPDAPLPADVIVVDEVSMVDLFLVRRLVGAVRAHQGTAARLVLIGDPDQLASVDVGTVLADLVDPAAGLRTHVTELTYAHRFRDAPSIADLAAAIREGRLDRAMDRLRGVPAEGDPEPERIRPMTDAGADPRSVVEHLVEPLATQGGLARQLREDRWKDRQDAPADPEAVARALAALDRYRILAAYRRGPLGSEQLARHVAEFVAKEARLPLRTTAGGAHAGAIVLVTRNDPRLDLRNGDVGLVLPDGGRLSAFFPTGDRPRRILASNLPPFEPGGAMTVHKSQGSQFDHVAFVVGDREGPLLSRELVYTAVTRARRRLDWYGDADVVARALERRVGRTSDLPRLLADACRRARSQAD